MLPFNTDQVVKVDSLTGQMTGYNHWPANLDLGGSVGGFFVGSFRGGALDGENIWMVPLNVWQVVKVNTLTGEMTSYDLPRDAWQGAGGSVFHECGAVELNLQDVSGIHVKRV